MEYKAIIIEPGEKIPQVDKYGTGTILGDKVNHCYDSPVPLRVWATNILKDSPDGSYGIIYRIEHTAVEVIKQECSEKP